MNDQLARVAAVVIVFMTVTTTMSFGFAYAETTPLCAYCRCSSHFMASVHSRVAVCRQSVSHCKKLFENRKERREGGGME